MMASLVGTQVCNVRDPCKDILELSRDFTRVSGEETTYFWEVGVNAQ